MSLFKSTTLDKIVILLLATGIGDFKSIEGLITGSEICLTVGDEWLLFEVDWDSIFSSSESFLIFERLISYIKFWYLILNLLWTSNLTTGLSAKITQAIKCLHDPWSKYCIQVQFVCKWYN